MSIPRIVSGRVRNYRALRDVELKGITRIVSPFWDQTVAGSQHCSMSLHFSLNVSRSDFGLRGTKRGRFQEMQDTRE